MEPGEGWDKGSVICGCICHLYLVTELQKKDLNSPSLEGTFKSSKPPAMAGHGTRPGFSKP